VAVPESQLETWSHAGSLVQSRDTYATVKSALEDKSSPYHSKSFHIRLQGSYANDTNVYRDSDVDLIIRLDSSFYHDAPTLPPDQYRIFERKYPGTAVYGLPEFKVEVANWLRQRFGDIEVGQKAIFIPGAGRRRDCDVLPCARFKYYYRVTEDDESFADGICFFLRDGTRIVNFPVQHSNNCTTKHGTTNQWFKPTVRLYKNMRNYLADRNILREGVAPSYFIEGMLWNVPSEKFGTSFGSTFIETFNHVINSDRSLFKCANGIHLLLGTSPINWPASNCQEYLDALRNLWNNWPKV
jgi:hypothetical protein